MVSFQCDVCQDVVKKPKLDTHSYRCHGSFTCVDCSKTFRTPAEWRIHTSCISEAEKYQKGLYKGKKSNGSGGMRGDKSSTAKDTLTNQSPNTGPEPKSSNGMDSNHPNKPDAAMEGSSGAPAARNASTDPNQPKEAMEKKKRKKRKAEKTHDASTDSATANIESKKMKKLKLDAADNDKGKTKTDERAERDTTKKDVPSMTTEVPGDSGIMKGRKEKKKEGKDKDDSVKINGGNQSGTPSQADSKPSASNLLKSGDHIARKKHKRKDDRPNDPIGQPTMSSDAAADVGLVKKAKKKERKEKDKLKTALEGDHATSVGKGESTSESSKSEEKKRKRHDNEGDDDGETSSSKKSKKEGKKTKEKKRKSKAVEQAADVLTT